MRTHDDTTKVRLHTHTHTREYTTLHSTTLLTHLGQRPIAVLQCKPVVLWSKVAEPAAHVVDGAKQLCGAIHVAPRGQQAVVAQLSCPHVFLRVSEVEAVDGQHSDDDNHHHAKGNADEGHCAGGMPGLSSRAEQRERE